MTDYVQTLKLANLILFNDALDEGLNPFRCPCCGSGVPVCVESGLPCSESCRGFSFDVCWECERAMGWRPRPSITVRRSKHGKLTRHRNWQVRDSTPGFERRFTYTTFASAIRNAHRLAYTGTVDTVDLCDMHRRSIDALDVTA